RAVEIERRPQRLAAGAVEPRRQEIPELVEPVGGNGEAGRHGMAAAIDQQARLARGDDRAAEVQPGDRAAGALAEAGLVEGDDAGRAAIALLQPARDDADDA